METWIITGGSSGIGAQIVADLVAEGMNLVVWDIHAPAVANGVVFEMVDLSVADQVKAAARKISGPVRAFVHCAAIGAPTGISHANLADQMRAAYEVNVVSFALAVHSLLPQLAAGKGSVVAVGSASMDVTYPAGLAYASSKAALRRAVQQMAVELGSRGIRVNCVAPGAIATPMTEARWSNKEWADERRSFIPLGRQGEPSAISDAVQFLVSDRAGYITGETLWVDGGVRYGIFNTAVQKADLKQWDAS